MLINRAGILCWSLGVLTLQLRAQTKVKFGRQLKSKASFMVMGTTALLKKVTASIRKKFTQQIKKSYVITCINVTSQYEKFWHSDKSRISVLGGRLPNATCAHYYRSISNQASTESKGSIW